MAVGRFNKIILGSGLTGTDNADDSITLEVTAASGIPATIFDAKGDLIGASAADTAARLAVGSDGDILTADSGESLGLKWEAPPSPGGGGAWTLLHTLTLSGAGTFDQSSISGSYNDLICVLIARGADAGGNDEANWRFNNDSGANYYRQRIRGLGSTASAAEGIPHTSLQFGILPAAAALASLFGVSVLTLFGYASTTWKKTTIWENAGPVNSTANNVYAHVGSGFWNSTAAVTRIQAFGGSTANLATGSQLRIYGRL